MLLRGCLASLNSWLSLLSSKKCFAAGSVLLKVSVLTSQLKAELLKRHIRTQAHLSQKIAQKPAALMHLQSSCLATQHFLAAPPQPLLQTCSVLPLYQPISQLWTRDAPSSLCHGLGGRHLSACPQKGFFLLLVPSLQEVNQLSDLRLGSWTGQPPNKADLHLSAPHPAHDCQKLAHQHTRSRAYRLCMAPLISCQQVTTSCQICMSLW